MNATMRAAAIDRYGPPEVLRLADLPRPAPSPGEILIRNMATVATPPDCAFRSANPFIVRLFAGLTRPKTPVIGDTVSGVVEAVGTGVTGFAVGDRVYGATGLGAGGYAEYLVAREDAALAPIPDGLGFGEAAAICEGYLTALPFLRDEGRVKPDDAVLVNGASGSVGTMAVQLARHFGAEVTGVCSARNVELVQSLGAHHVIDYGREDFAAARERYDVIFDAVGKSSFARCRAALKPGGIYLTTVPSLGIVLDMLWRTRGTGRRARLATTGLRPAADKRKDLGLLNQLIAAGAVRPVIDRTYPLEEIVAAHHYVETGRKRGSVVIDIAAGAAGTGDALI